MIIALGLMTNKAEIEKGAQCCMDDFLTNRPEIDRFRFVLKKSFNQ